MADWLQPICQRMHRDLLASGYVQCDETPIRCQDPDVPGQTVQGWLWGVSRPDGNIVFAWRMSRRQDEATTLLAGFKGVLQSDAYPAQPAFARQNDGVVCVECWAHARRRFHEALETAPVQAGLVLRLIGHLYAMVKQSDQATQTGPALRASRRQSDFAPRLSLLNKVARKLSAWVLPKTLLGEACHYLLAQWEPLTAHLQHGKTRLDNNLVENAIRLSAIGKKNWLFIGHPDAGQRSAIIYSLVASCQRHGKDPLAYLRDVLRRLPSMSNQDDLTPLTPAVWQPSSAGPEW